MNSNVDVDSRSNVRSVEINATILVVDDDYHLQSMSREILAMQGFSVLTASSGQEAIGILTSHPERIQIAILNIAMSGMGGIETIKALRSYDPSIKTVISSNFHPSKKVMDQLGSSVDAFLNKPYEVDRMLVEIGRLLDEWSKENT